MEKNTMIVCVVIAALVVVGGIAMLGMGHHETPNETSKITIIDTYKEPGDPAELTDIQLYITSSDGKEYKLTGDNVKKYASINDNGHARIYSKGLTWTYDDGSGYFYNTDNNIRFKLEFITGTTSVEMSEKGGNAIFDISFDKQSIINIKLSYNALS